ncbi:MAG: DnaJ domain-containing protein [Candidatus Poribacteria bacterium]|nr:DnaJ domain-containing protein [Candidatus Poribacteria bacterium]
MTPEHAYEILGLNSDVSRDDAKKAYRELVKVYHPDKNTAANANVMFRLIQDAWNCLQSAYEEEIIQPINDAEFYNNQGISKFELGEYVAAIFNFDMALRLNSNDVETYITQVAS